jgi:exopolyphosphatase/guanosine-5'-triphosphate,3'-diphosphate pyrophosphatase
MQAKSVRVVGTNTLRKARRKSGFLERAREVLGHPIEIISGIEEARLIYAGVIQTMPLEPGRRLVVDIGGGSTECIIGEGYEPRILESLYMGCVALSGEFFPEGRFSARRFEKAVMHCAQELEPLRVPFRGVGWEHAVGSSGSVRSISDAIREIDPSASAITRTALNELTDRLLRAGNIRGAGLSSISEERWPVFAGGVAILTAVFDAFNIESMRVAEGALREGLLYDMLGRLTNEDARERSVRSMMARFHVDQEQAERVAATCAALLAEVAGPWKLEEALAESALRWGARLHEIGLDISHSGHHKHASYLLEHADLPGFPREEQLLLARLVGAHRRKLAMERVDELMPPWHLKVLYLIVLLRLAVLLHRGRSRAPLPPLKLMAGLRSLEVRFPRGWLREHALTVADLEQEVEFLRAANFRLRVY